MEYEVLFSKMNIGSLELKNRIVMAPMMMGFGAFDGTPTQALLDYYEERAKGGAGLIISEITRVDDVTGAGAFSQLAVSHDYHIEPLKELVKRVHKYGAKLFIQLHHPGRQNLGLLVGTVPLSIFMNKHFPFYEQMLYKIVPFGKKLMDKQLVPRVVAPSKVEPAYFSNSKTKEMSKNSIEKIIKAFVDGAVRVQKAGADGVELHAAHGYLIQQFLSPHTNRRTDEYGGSLDNRMRFILEIIKGIKEKCSESFPIAVRLSVDECYDRIGFKGRGITLKEGVAIAKRLEEAGIDAIDVSSGGYDTFNFWLEPTSFSPGWRKYMAAEVKKEVSIPVIAANLIRSPEQAEQQLIEGVQDLVALGRPLLADAHWSDKVKQDNSKSIKRCINCLYCFESMQVNAYKGGHGLCSVNPRLGREKEELIKDGNGRTVVIIGAGAAGLTAAEMLCLRGFKVIIFEKEAVAGGQLNLTKALPHKEKLSWCIEDLQNTVESLSAEIRFNTEATTDAIKELTPYAVIVATGGKSTVPKSLKGINSSKIYTSTDVLNGTVKFEGKSVAVIGSGMTGLETALYIAEKGNNVKVIELLPEIGKGVWFQHIDDIIPRLNALGVTFLSDCSLNEVREDNVFVSLGRDENLEIPVDYTVFAMGVTPENSLVYELKKDFENVYVIGDAAKPGRIASATMSAFLVASSL